MRNRAKRAFGCSLVNSRASLSRALLGISGLGLEVGGLLSMTLQKSINRSCSRTARLARRYGDSVDFAAPVEVEVLEHALFKDWRVDTG